MDKPLSAEHFAWLVGSLCRLGRVPFDAALLTQRFPAPHGRAQLLAALQALGFTTGHGSLAKPVFPCIAFLKDGMPVLALKAEGRRLLYFEPGAHKGAVADRDAFEPHAVFARHESEKEVDESARSFGFAWFWRELVKHKAVWRDVLAASLFIQLVGLATPIFTQVVIDKVVVHHATSTLAVIAAGLAMFLSNAILNFKRL